MNVLMVAPEYPPNVIGGGGAVYARIAEHFAGSGHRVTVVFGNFANKNWLAAHTESNAEENLRFVSVPLLPTPGRMQWALSAMPPTPRAAASVLRYIGKRTWDVAHLHGVGFPLVDMCAALLRLRRVPYVFTAHGIPRSPFTRGWAARAMVGAYLRGASRRTVAGAAQVTAVSDSLLRDPALPITRGKIVPNGIDLPDTPARNDVTKSANGTLRLLSISRLSVNKGIDIAIRAVAALCRVRSVEYDIYGPDGGDGADFRELAATLGAADVVRFRGTFAPSEREEIFARYDALLMPSRVEGFGLAALEALACGLPVIAHPVDGLAQFLNEENAVLVRNESPSSWRDALEELADSPAAAASRISAGRTTAQGFSWTRILRLYEQELVAATSNQRPRYGAFARVAF
jgi:glycosyltransferase involved in cell wall biosynthesis